VSQSCFILQQLIPGECCHYWIFLGCHRKVVTTGPGHFPTGGLSGEGRISCWLFVPLILKIVHYTHLSFYSLGC
jgi:hypothetical protein